MTSPIDIVKSFYDALGRGDASAALGLLSPDMEWNVVAGWPYKPTGRGPKGVAEGVLKPVFKEWRDYALHGSDLLVAGDKVVSMGLMTGVHTVTGKPLEAAYVHVWEVADGQIVRMRQTCGYRARDGGPVVSARVALVTGASRGIGKATAVRLARDFASVALVARSAEGLADTAEAIKVAGADPSS